MSRNANSFVDFPIFSFALCTLIFTANLSAEATPDFDVILDRFQAAVQLPDRLAITATESSKTFVNGKLDSSLTGEDRISYKQNSDQIDASEEFYSISFGPHAPIATKRVTQRFVVTHDQVFQRQDTLGGTVGILYLSRTHGTDLAKWRLLNSRVMDGYIDGDGNRNSIVQTMKSGTNKSVVTKNNPDGNLEYALHADTPYGEHWLQISARTFLPSYFEVLQRQPCKNNDDTLDSAILSRHCKFFNFKTTFVNKREICISLDCTISIVYKEGGERSDRIQVVRHKIDFDPKFDQHTDFVPQFPANTEILVEPAAGNIHTWKMRPPLEG